MILMNRFEVSYDAYPIIKHFPKEKVKNNKSTLRLLSIEKASLKVY